MLIALLLEVLAEVEMAMAVVLVAKMELPILVVVQVGRQIIQEQVNQAVLGLLFFQFQLRIILEQLQARPQSLHQARTQF